MHSELRKTDILFRVNICLASVFPRASSRFGATKSSDQDGIIPEEHLLTQSHSVTALSWFGL